MTRTCLRSFAALSVLFLLAAPQTVAAERFEKTLNEEAELTAGTALVLENLIGSLTVRGDRTGGKALIEARVVVEADENSEARALAETVAVKTERDGNNLVMRVTYPVDRYTAFKLPRSEKDGLLSKWVTPLVRKSKVATVYDGHTVEVGPAKGAVAIAVHLVVTLPLDVEATMRQVVGNTHAIGVRGKFTLEVIEGQIIAEQVYGTLETRSGGGEVIVRKFSGEELRSQTGSGNLSLLEIRADKAHLRSNSGKIDGSGINIGSLQVESGTGNVRLDEVDTVAFEVTTGEGAVDLAAKITRTREAWIRTATGDVTLRVSRATPFDLDAAATNGSVKYKDVSADVLEEEKTRLRLQRGGGGAAIHVTTDKGEVLVTPSGS